MTEILLANFLFLLFPVSMYLIFFENSTASFTNKIWLFIFAALSMILCMSFPIQLEHGFMYDLRYIPFVLSALFGGYAIAFPMYLVLNVYRFIIGGEFAVDSFAFSTIIFIVLPVFSSWFLGKAPQIRITAATLASFAVMAFYLFTLLRFFELGDLSFWHIAVNVLLIHVLGTLFIVMLIEKIIANIETRERMLQSERLAIVSELSASVAHEIRNPLTVTSGFLQLLQQSEVIETKEKRYVDLSLLEVKRAEEIVTDFLSLAKPQAQNMVLSDLKEEIEYVRNIMLPFANMHSIKLKLFFHNTLKKRFDENQMKQCLINICKNGIEAMQEKEGTLFIEVVEEKGNIVIRIADEGKGMSPSQVADIGKPYYSTKKEGTGLGMLMVFSTIDKLGGKVDVDSTMKEGTKFTITIPPDAA